MDSPFVTIPVQFAGTRPMYLTLHVEHVMGRWKERMGKEFRSGSDCAKYMSRCFLDSRLAVIAEKAPRYSKIALIFEEQGFSAFFDFGTAFNKDEIKIRTIYPYNPTTRLLVDETDLCYRLPADGQKLKFGKERKFFELKRRKN